MRTNKVSFTKPFLKWPGGKFRLLDRIRNRLDHGKRLVEPFVGSGAVFLNTSYKKYLLADTNPDLINLYLYLQKCTPTRYQSQFQHRWLHMAQQHRLLPPQ